MTTDIPKSEMTPEQPYLLRAIYEWIVDNDMTPYLLVDASQEGVEVPTEHLNDEQQIILNVSPSATSELLMSNECITFNARFSGQAMTIMLPSASVLAIYSKENGQGMWFNDRSSPPPDSPSGNKPAGVNAPRGKPPKGKPESKRPQLKVVK